MLYNMKTLILLPLLPVLGMLHSICLSSGLSFVLQQNLLLDLFALGLGFRLHLLVFAHHVFRSNFFFLFHGSFLGSESLGPSSDLDISHSQQLWVFGNQLSVGSNLLLLVSSHSVLVESSLSLLSDLLDSGHGSKCSGNQVSVVSDWNISSGSEGQGRIYNQLLTSSLSEGLGPSQLTWVTTLLESFVTFGTTESELLSIVSDKQNTVQWVYWRRAKMALYYSHCLCNLTVWICYVVVELLGIRLFDVVKNYDKLLVKNCYDNEVSARRNKK